VEFRKSPGIVPDPPTVGVEDVGAVPVNVNAAEGLSKTVAADMAAFVDHQTFAACISQVPRED
jgi:hypothetical protein